MIKNFENSALSSRRDMDRKTQSIIESNASIYQVGDELLSKYMIHSENKIDIRDSKIQFTYSLGSVSQLEIVKGEIFSENPKSPSRLESYTTIYNKEPSEILHESRTSLGGTKNLEADSILKDIFQDKELRKQAALNFQTQRYTFKGIVSWLLIVIDSNSPEALTSPSELQIHRLSLTV